jgi:hypothetical protein
MQTSETSINAVESMDEQVRRNIVIDFISQHKGCTAEDIVRGQDKIGRGKVFKILKNLKKEAIVKPEKSDTNQRDIALFIDNDHPIILFSTEFREFKNYLYSLIDKAINIRLKDPLDDYLYPSFELLGTCIIVFLEYLKMTHYRAFFLWSKKVQDPETLRKLYKLFYSETTNLYLEILSKFKPAFVNSKGYDLEDKFLGVARDYGSELLVPEDIHLAQLDQIFEYYRVKTEATPILKFLINIRSKIYDSQYKTKEDEYYSSEEFRKDELERNKVAEEMLRDLNPPGHKELLRRHTDKSGVTHFDGVFEEEGRRKKIQKKQTTRASVVKRFRKSHKKKKRL